jgi:hypothetical protein
MYMELGDFLSAEKYLLVARANTKHKPLDPTYFKLKVMLATVYLSSYCYFECGLRTLENLMHLNPQAEIHKVITEKLIVAYIKKGWFNEGVAALGSLKSMIDEDVKYVGS